jgi:ABC-type sulfate transport system permease component
MIAIYIDPIVEYILARIVALYMAPTVAYYNDQKNRYLYGSYNSLYNDKMVASYVATIVPYIITRILALIIAHIVAYIMSR